MSDSISLFEAKAHLSELVRTIAATGRGVALTVRGKPMVRIVPYEQPEERFDAWDVREQVVQAYGLPDFKEARRAVEVPTNPFLDE